jgi:hypothetical protein
MGTFQENRESEAPDNKLNTYALETAEAAVGFFIVGEKDDNVFHEGLYRCRCGSHKACDQIWLECSEYLFEVVDAVQVDMDPGDYWDIVFGLASQLEKIPNDYWKESA